MSEHAVPDESNPPASDGLAAYVAALGVANPDAATRLADALRQRASADGDADATTTVGHAIAALDAFLDQAAARVADGIPAGDDEPCRSPAAVRFTLTRHLSTLLSDHPTAPADPAADTAFTAALAEHHDALPGGVLPTHPQQEMPRQPLGALPAVLRSQFWTSAYRFGPFGNRRNSAAADDSPRPTGVADPLRAPAATSAAADPAADPSTDPRANEPPA